MGDEFDGKAWGSDERGLELQSKPEELSPWERVRVKWFNRHQGFGFVSRTEGAGDIFITRSVLKRCRVLWPSPNERLDVRWMLDAQGRLRAGTVAYPVGFVE